MLTYKQSLSCRGVGKINHRSQWLSSDDKHGPQSAPETLHLFEDKRETEGPKSAAKMWQIELMRHTEAYSSRLISHSDLIESRPAEIPKTHSLCVCDNAHAQEERLKKEGKSTTIATCVFFGAHFHSSTSWCCFFFLLSSCALLNFLLSLSHLLNQ